MSSNPFTWPEQAIKLTSGQVENKLTKLKNWQLTKDQSALQAEFELTDFAEAVALFNQIALLAQQHDHHPDLSLFDYKNLLVILSTHQVGGLSEKDFYLAAAINKFKLAATSIV